MNKEPDSWITINGQHVPIFEGEGKREAVSRFLKGKSRVARNKDKYDTISQYKKRKATNKLDEDNFEYRGDKKDFKKLIKKGDNRYIVVRNDETEDEAIRKFNEREKINNRKDIEEQQERDKFLRSGGRVYEDLEEQRKAYAQAKEREDTAIDYKPRHTKASEEKESNIDDATRRQALINYLQKNREQVDKWVKDYDDETHKRVSEKIARGEGLTAKEYYGALGSDLKPGSIILEEFPDGENAVVANDGNFVRESRIKEYNRNPRANQDAVYSRKDEETWEKELEKINKYKKRKSSNK